MMMRGNSFLAAAVLGLAALVLAVPAHAVGTPAGTDITNQATVDYEDVNGNPLQALSNVVTTTVSQVAAVDVSPDNATSADPGDVVYYAHVVTNNGNGDDTIDMTAVSSNGWTVQVYHDVNGNGLYDAGTDLLLTDTDADGVPEEGTVSGLAGTTALLGRFGKEDCGAGTDSIRRDGPTAGPAPGPYIAAPAGGWTASTPCGIGPAEAPATGAAAQLGTSR